MEAIINSKDNRMVKYAAKLQKSASFRREENLFPVEGARLCEDALNSKAEIKYFFYSETADKKYHTIIKKISEKCPNTYSVKESVFPKMCDTVTPQGMLSLVSPLDKSRVFDTIKKYNKLKFLALECVQDPGNMGTILRTADALGIDGIIISSNSCDVFSPKVIRGTMGAVFRLPIFITDDICGYIKRFNENGSSYATVPVNAHKAVTEIDFKSGNVIAAIGNEGNGLTKECMEACSCKITIPMTGNAESLNAGIAAGIVMWEMVR